MNRQYPHIEPRCNEVQGYCLHWYISHFGARPQLGYGNHLRAHAPLDSSLGLHLSSAKSPLTGCGNPWNLMTMEEIDKIYDTRPPTESPLGPCREDLTSIEEIDREKLEEELTSFVGADCWACYSRDPKSLAPIKVFFNYPSDMIPRDHHKEFPEMSRVRTELINSPTALITELDAGREVVCGMGEILGNCYFRKVGEKYLGVYVQRRV